MSSKEIAPRLSLKIEKETELSQPLLLESMEFRRKVDADRADALLKVNKLESEIMTIDIQLKQLQKRRDDLMLIVHAADQVLVLVPGPRDGGSTQAEPDEQE